MNCENCQGYDFCAKRKSGNQLKTPKCFIDAREVRGKKGRYDHGVGTIEDDEIYPHRTGAQKAARNHVDSLFGRGNLPPPIREDDGRTVKYKDSRRGITVTLRTDTDDPSTIIPLAGSIDTSSRIRQRDGSVKRKKKHFGWSKD